MEIALLRTFLAVHETGSITRAARRRGLGQPAISGHIARLEAEVGATLFHRGAHGVIPTEAGNVWRAVAEDVVRRLDTGREALDALKGAMTGTLRIGAGATVTTKLLPSWMRRYHERWPGVRIFVREQGSAAAVEALLAGEIDLGFVTLPISDARKPLRVVPWLRDQLRLVVPPDHPLRHEATFRWLDLDGQPLVLFEAGSAVRRRIDDAFERAGVVPQIVMELRSIEAILRMVEAGVGAGFVSQVALAEQAGLAPEGEPLVRELAIVRRSDRPPTAATRAFLELLANERDRGVPLHP